MRYASYSRVYAIITNCCYRFEDAQLKWPMSCFKCLKCKQYIGILYTLNFMTPPDVICTDRELRKTQVRRCGA